jgi:hypothetical protein
MGWGLRGGRYEYYASFATWPEPLRADLRAGIKAKQQGDLALSVRFLRRCARPPLLSPCMY